MNIAVKPMTAEAFMAWLEHQPSWRFELVNGQVIAMNAQRLEHIETKLAVANALRAAVRNTEFHGIGDGMCVRVDVQTVYEPDALIYGGRRKPAATTVIEDPIVVVEVLSPGTKTVDTTKKLEGYFKLASVRHYLIVDPAARTIVHHARRGDAEFATTLHNDGDLDLSAIGVRVPVAACFPETD